MLEQKGIKFRRSFPIGYLFHPDPFNSNYDSDTTVNFLSNLFELINQRKSYLKVDNKGIDIYWREGNIINIKWEKVLRLEKQRRYGVLLDMLYFDYDISVYDKNNKLLFLTEGIKKRYFEIQKEKPFGIPLQAYQGWPNGQLLEEIRKYIPEIIANAK